MTPAKDPKQGRRGDTVDRSSAPPSHSIPPPWATAARHRGTQQRANVGHSSLPLWAIAARYRGPQQRATMGHSSAHTGANGR